jgi:hypothetical protein
MKNKKAGQTEILDLGKIIAILIIIFMGVYILTMAITGDFKKENKDPEFELETFIQYNEILAGEIFNRPENEYRVIFYDFESDEGKLIDAIVDNYISKGNEIKLYKVNLANGFNKMIYDKENPNIETSEIDKFKVNDTLLIKVKDKENVLQITEISEIYEKIN